MKSFTRPVVRLLAASLAALLATLVGVVTTQTPAAASSTMFVADSHWTGMFGGASIIKVGSTYWAYSTTTGGDNLPVLHSTDLKTWTARSAYPADHNPGWWKGYNDALPSPARWALYYIHRNGRAFTSLWSPSVAYVGGKYVDYYAVSIGRAARHCISVATANRPDGPFVDNTTAPVVCSSDPNGTIDPHLVVDGTRAYLIWKNAGVIGSKPTQIWTRELNSNGLGWAPGSHNHLLLQTARPWEGSVVENPAMIHYAGRYYLFYSGNSYWTTKYATGYAICAGPFGPCRRPAAPGPLLASSPAVGYGPGSASPFVGPKGQLMLSYGAWSTANPTNNPVRLRLATLTVNRNGTLSAAPGVHG